MINVAGEAKHMVEDDHYSQEKLVKGSYVVLQTDSVCTLWLNIIEKKFVCRMNVQINNKIINVGVL